MSEPSMEEKRRYKRRSLAYYMLVVDANTEESIGRLIDLTSDGFLMDSTKQLPVAQVFHMRVETMADVTEKNFITFTARCQWCMPDAIEPNMYDAGFQITEIALEDAEILKRIAEKYAAQDGFSYRQL
jgi:hypothetical protein